MNEMSKTENEPENSMNQKKIVTQRKVNQQTNFPLISKSQGSEKSPNCQIKSDLQKIQAQKNWGMRKSQMSTKNQVLQFLS